MDSQVLGLQFHLEMTREGLSQLFDHGRDELMDSESRFIQAKEDLLGDGLFEGNHRTAEQLFDRFFG